MSEERKHELVLGTHGKQMVAQVREIVPDATVPQVLKTALATYTKLRGAENPADLALRSDALMLEAVECLAQDAPHLKEALGLASLLANGEESTREAVMQTVFGKKTAEPA